MTDRSVDARIDARAVAQASLLGSVADDVLEALLWASAGRKDLATSAAIARAAELFEQAADQADAPATLWQRNDAPNALRRMAMARLGKGAPEYGDARLLWPKESLRDVADTLQTIKSGAATESDLDRLRAYFEAMSNATIDGATELTHARRSNPVWSTI